VKSVVVLVTAAVVLSSCPAGAATAYVEAESYTVSHDLGYTLIAPYGILLQGLDVSGEWTEYVLPQLPFGTYRVSMRCWGEVNVPYELHLKTFPVQGEEPQTIDLKFTGLGSDCS
jgi:hypothetical protein